MVPKNGSESCIFRISYMFFWLAVYSCRRFTSKFEVCVSFIRQLIGLQTSQIKCHEMVENTVRTCREFCGMTDRWWCQSFHATIHMRLLVVATDNMKLIQPGIMDKENCYCSMELRTRHSTQNRKSWLFKSSGLDLVLTIYRHGRRVLIILIH